MPSPQSDANDETAYRNTGAVEQDRPEQPTNVAPLNAQMDHQFQDPLVKSNDTDYPEPGQNPEFSGELQGRNELERDTNSNPEPVRREIEHADKNRLGRMDADNFSDTDQNAQQKPPVGKKQRDPDGNNPEGVTQTQDPGVRQKENQNKKKDDDLAA